MNDEEWWCRVLAPRQLMQLVIDGDILGKDRSLARQYGERIYKVMGFEGMQEHALNMRIAYRYCCPFEENEFGDMESKWSGHPQEYDFAWEGIGPWRA